MFYFLNNFLIYSIFGFFFETILFKLISLHNHSGFMFLWWTPFYGTGVILTIILYNLIEKRTKTNKQKNIVFFITMFIVLTLLEYLGGNLLEVMHGYPLWTYEHIPLHIGRYISIGTSLAWTLFSFLYIYVIKKYTDKLIERIPKWVTIVASLIFISDLFVTMIKLIIAHIN